MQPPIGVMLWGMKIYAYRERFSFDALHASPAPLPEPGPHDIVLRMRAVSLNYRDLAIGRGEYGAYALPRVPLSDGAGEVVAVGSEVTRFALGDLAIPAYVPDWIDGPLTEAKGRRRLGGPVDGVFAEAIRVHEAEAVRAPAHLDALAASTLAVAGVTAWQLLFGNGAPLRPGETVAVQGSGGVSLFVLALAKAAGATVYSVARRSPRWARLEALGARIVDPDATSWPQTLVAATRGGVDRFVDVVGGDGVQQSVAATRVGGTIDLVGFVGGARANVDLVALMQRALTVRAASGGSRASLEGLVASLAAWKLTPVIDSVLPVERWREGFERLATGRPFGKVVLAFDDVSS